MIDRFLADIMSEKGNLKVDVGTFNLQKVLSMLLMLATRGVKAFPKIIAIIESVIRSPFGNAHTGEIVAYLERYLKNLSEDEERNKYLISWISYFLISNNLKRHLTFRPKYKDLITRSVFNNRGLVFKGCPDFDIFVGSLKIGKRMSMLDYLDIFNTPKFA